MIPAGLVLMPATGEAPVLPAPPDLALLAAAFLVGATRTGEISVVVLSRYSRLLFTLVLGGVVFGERPDAPMLAGPA